MSVQMIGQPKGGSLLVMEITTSYVIGFTSQVRSLKVYSSIVTINKILRATIGSIR